MSCAYNWVGSRREGPTGCPLMCAELEETAKITDQICYIYSCKHFKSKLAFIFRITSVHSLLFSNSKARGWRHDSDKTQTNKLEWWMILKISWRAKAGVPKTLVKYTSPIFPVFPSEHAYVDWVSRGICALRYFGEQAFHAVKLK